MVGYEGDKFMKYRKIAIQLAMQGFDAPRAVDCMEVGDVNINLKDVNPETWKPILKTAIERATLEGRAKRKRTMESNGCSQCFRRIGRGGDTARKNARRYIESKIT